MKKTNLLVLSAAAALLATSCSKDQVTQSNPGESIKFNALTGSATKATEVNSTTSIPSFKVHARFGTSTTLNFDETYTKGGDGTVTWTPESGETHYWPNSADEKVKFWAYSPVTLSTDFAASADAPLTVTPPSDTNSAFTVSNIRPNLHASLQKDLVIAQTSTAKTAGNAVTLKFQHVLSQIELQASSGDDNMRVTVYGAKIFGFTVPASNLTWKATTGAEQIRNVWSAQTSTAMAYMVGGSDVENPVVLSSTAAPIMGTNGNGDGNFMVIPQQLTTAWNYANNGGAYIAVLCKIEKSDGAGGYNQIFPTDGVTKCAFTAVPFTQNFEIGKKYTFKLQFFTNNGGGGVTPPDPIDPTNPTDPDIDPENPNTPILAPMSFSVSVSDWTAGTTTATDGNLPLQ